MTWRNTLAAAAVLLAFGGCSSEESRMETAQEIGAVDIDPRRSFGAIKAAIPLPANVKTPQGKHGIENLVQARWGEGLIARPLVELGFYAPGHRIDDASVPINVTVRPPFLGTLLGVRIGDPAQTALVAVRRRYPAAYLSPTPPRKLRPDDTSEGWTIHLDRSHLLVYDKMHRIRRGKMVQPPEYSVSLRYSTAGFTIRSKEPN